MANKLAYFLRRTAAIHVNVNFAQVVELLGEDKAHELNNYVVGKNEVRHRRVGPRSAIPASKRLDIVQLANFNKDVLLEAIEELHGKNFQEDGTDPTPKFNAVPNEKVTPKSHVLELKARGLMK